MIWDGPSKMMCQHIYSSLAGVVFSALLFKRKSWPIVFGTGSGFGMGYANCQNEFNAPFKTKK